VSDKPPALSVVIAATTSLAEARACLETIARQSDGRPVEILVTHSNGTPPADWVRDYPGVTFLSLPPGAPLPRHLGVAVARAAGEIIAVTEGTCEIGDGWVGAILENHQSPHPVVGGAVEPRDLRTPVDWAAYFSEYGQFMLPLAAGQTAEVPGNNLSLKRWALAHGRQFVDGEFWKTLWCRHLQAEGHRLYAAPSPVVYYRKSFRFWPFLARRVHHGRCFAGMRVAQISFARRVLHLLTTPGLPVLFCARVFRAVLPKRRYRGQFFASVPIIVLATIAWTIGEFVGYLGGPGEGCRHVR